MTHLPARPSRARRRPWIAEVHQTKYGRHLLLPD
jgi:hypothetical protein